MPSQLRSDTARANGARSKGPITPAGKSKAAQNALRHGLSAKRIVIPDESLTEYRALLNAYLDEFHPQTALQAELVTVMAAARWRLRRLTAIEASLFFNELNIRKERIDEDLKNPTLDDRLAWVFKRLVDNSQAPSLLSRYEATLTRSHDRAFKQLISLQARKSEITRSRLDVEIVPEHSESHAPPAESQHTPAADDTELACTRSAERETPADLANLDASTEHSNPLEDELPTKRMFHEQPQEIADQLQNQRDRLNNPRDHLDPRLP